MYKQFLLKFLFSDLFKEDNSSCQLSRQQLWDLLQTTEAELRARLVQAETQRDEYANKLEQQEHFQRTHVSVNSHIIHRNNGQNNINSIYEVPITLESGNKYSVKNSNSNNFRDYERTGSMERSLKSDLFTSLDDRFATPYLGETYELSKRDFARAVSADYENPSVNMKRLNDKELSKKNLKQARSLSTDRSKLLRHSSEDIPIKNQNLQHRSTRKKRSLSRSRRQVYSCTSSSSDEITDMSYPFVTPPTVPMLRTEPAEDSSDSSEDLRQRDKIIKRKRSKYRSTSSQPDSSRKRSDLVSEKMISSKQLYGHVFRSLPDVEHVDDIHCSTLASEFVYSHDFRSKPLIKSLDVELPEFDDLSCTDIPAPKFDDSSSSDDYPKSEQIISHRKPFPVDQTYKRYPMYSGLFHSKAVAPSSSQGFEKRKSMLETDLSPLPVLKSFQKQLTEQKEKQRKQKLAEDHEKSYWSREGTLLRRDETSFTSKIVDKINDPYNAVRERFSPPVTNTHGEKSYKNVVGFLNSSKSNGSQPSRRYIDNKSDITYSKPVIRLQSSLHPTEDNNWRSTKSHRDQLSSRYECKAGKDKISRSIDDSCSAGKGYSFDHQEQSFERESLYFGQDRSIYKEPYYARGDQYSQRMSDHSNKVNKSLWSDHRSHQHYTSLHGNGASASALHGDASSAYHAHESHFTTSDSSGIVKPIPVYKRPIYKPLHDNITYASYGSSPNTVTSYPSRPYSLELDPQSSKAEADCVVIRERKRGSSKERKGEKSHDITTKV